MLPKVSRGLRTLNMPVGWDMLVGVSVTTGRYDQYESGAMRLDFDDSV